MTKKLAETVFMLHTNGFSQNFFASSKLPIVYNHHGW